MTGFVADYPTEILSACSVVFAWFEVVGKEENAAEGCGNHGEWESMAWLGLELGGQLCAQVQSVSSGSPRDAALDGTTGPKITYTSI